MASKRLFVALLLGLGLACAKGQLVGSAVPLPPPTRPVPELELALESPDPATRANAAWDIAGALKASQATATRLLELSLHDPDVGVRNAAAWAFGHVVQASPGGKDLEQYDQAPRLISQPRLVYPRDAFDAKVYGLVEVDVLIDEQGNVARAEIRKSIARLDQAALDNVRLWKFEPARKAGKPVPVIALAPVTFQIY
jgi:periplasmic protein TonB